MARQGQFPVPIPNPADPYILLPPPAVPASMTVHNSDIPPPPQQQSSLYVTGKRQRHDGGHETSGQGEERCSKRLAAQDVIFRIVMPSNLIGKVIGKEGARIRKVREETRATIKIADAISRHEERVIIISSKERDDSGSDAEIALQQIASLILKEDENSEEVLKGHVVASTIRLLVAGTQAGSLIGASGQNIEKIRNASGATIIVLTQIPLCASAHESDRVVQISGEVSAVMKALEDISRVLRENPARQVISISPAYNLCAYRAPQQYMNPVTGQPILQLLIMLPWR
uniref:K Homology domain-containing protein n=1 Tax=Kalanchoe fedtschenkoi TaxID=63787 RepID=A0A7N0UQ79_KALFE